MKKIKYIAFLLAGTLASLAFAADVKPFYFSYISSSDPNYDSLQQEEWNYLMKFKMFGTNGITFGNEKIRVTDSVGWFGTSKGSLSMGINGKDTVGGPILVGKNLTFTLGPDVFTTGPLYVNGNVYVTGDGFKNNGNRFAGEICVGGTADSKFLAFIDDSKEHININNDENVKCPEDVPSINTNLQIPVVSSHTTNATISIPALDNSEYVITVPKGDFKDAYDITVNGTITMSNRSKIVIRQQNGGRLTRIFVNDGFDFRSSSLNKIVVAYEDVDEDGNGLGTYTELKNDQYSGSLLFYTTKDITFPSMSAGEAFFQGSFITTGTININHHLVLSGQVLANNIIIDTDFDGSTFIYVPFDPPVLDIDPQLLNEGRWPEVGLDSLVPIHLDTVPNTDVTFSYCFAVKDTTQETVPEHVASVQDFKKTQKSKFPVCNIDTAHVLIKEGELEPTDDTKIYINVVPDDLMEGDEDLTLKIFGLAGAVMPGNKKSGQFILKITDLSAPKFNNDDTDAYRQFENTPETVANNGDTLKIIELKNINWDRKDSILIEMRDTSLAGGAAGSISALDLFEFVLDTNVTTRKVQTMIKVKDAASLDYETIPANYDVVLTLKQIKVSAEGDVGTFVVDTLIRTISIVDVNEIPTIKSIYDAKTPSVLMFDTLRPSENLAMDSAVGVVLAEDPDTKSEGRFSHLDYFVVETDGAVPFAMRKDTIVVTNPSLLNYEVDSVFKFSVLVQNCDWDVAANIAIPGGKCHEVTKEVVVKLQNVPEDPKIECLDDDDNCDGPYVAIENSALDSIIHTFVVLDEDIGQVGVLEPTLTDNNGKNAADLFKVVIDQDATTGNWLLKVEVKSNIDYETVEPSYSVRISVKDKDNLTAFIDRVINILDVNEVPTITGVTEMNADYDGPTAEFTVFPKENLENGDSVGVVVATDPDTKHVEMFGQLEYAIVDPNGTIPFEMSHDTIVVKDASKMNFELADELTYEFEVKVTNCEWDVENNVVTDRCLETSQMVTVKVQNVPEDPKIDCVEGDENCDGPYIVVENSKKDSVIHEFVLTDDDNGQVAGLIPTLTDNNGRNAADLFKAVVEQDATTGAWLLKIEVEGDIDYETIDASYDVKVTVTDADGLTASIDRVLNIQDVNEVPTITGVTEMNADYDGPLAEFTLFPKENLKNGDSVGVVVATDPDTKHVEMFGQLEYAIVDPNGTIPFEMSHDTIVVKDESMMNHEGNSEFTFEVKVTNCEWDVVNNVVTDRCLETSQTVIVKIQNVPEGPVITCKTGDPNCDGPYDVIENSKKDSVIHEFILTDDDNNQVAGLIPTLTDNNGRNAADLFKAVIEQDATTGEWLLKIEVEGDIDYETIDASYDVKVTVTDADGLTASIDRVLNIKDVNEIPTITGVTEMNADYTGTQESFTLYPNENLKNGDSVGVVVATDPDIKHVEMFGQLDYAIVDPNGTIPFVMSHDTIVVKDESMMNHEGNSEFTFEVKVTNCEWDVVNNVVTDRCLETSQTVTVKIQNVPEKPVITCKVGDTNCDGPYVVIENSKKDSVIHEFVVTDDDNGQVATLIPTLTDNNGSNAADLFKAVIEQDATTGEWLLKIEVKGDIDYESIDSVYSVRVTVTDADGLTDVIDRVLNIRDVNEVPTIAGVTEMNADYTGTTETFTLYPKENLKNGDSVGVVVATDPDTKHVEMFAQLDYSIVDPNGTIPFVMSHDTIVVKDESMMNFEGDSEFTFEVKVTNCEWDVVNNVVTDRCLETSQTVTVKIQNVPEKPVITCKVGDTNCDGPYVVIENSKKDSVIHEFVVTDDDNGQVATLIPTLTDNNGSNAADLFKAVIEQDTTTGEWLLKIEVKGDIDYESIDSVYSVKVTVTDADGLTDTIDRVLNIRDVNEAPTVDPFNKEITENLPNGSTVGELVAADPDTKHSEYSQLAYRIIEENVPFTLDSNVIKVADSEKLDYETNPTFTFRVEVSDGEFQDTALVTIKLSDEDENPKIIVDDGPDGEDDFDSLCVAHCDTTNRGSGPDSILTIGIDENKPTGTVVFQYVVSDEDRDEVKRLIPSLRDNDNSGADSIFKAVMKQDSNKWYIAVVVADGGKLDFEKINDMHKVTVIVTDSTGLADSIVRVIQVRDVNEAPTLEPFDKQIEENLPNGAVVGELVAADPDIKNPAFSHLTYTILGADMVPFVLDSNVIKVADGSKLDYEKNHEFKFNVEVSDGVYKDTALVTIRLQDVDETPKIITDDGPDGLDDNDSVCVAHCDTTNRGSGDEHGKDALTVGIDENVKTGTVVLQYWVYDEDADDLKKLEPSLEQIEASVEGSSANDLFAITKQQVGDKWKIVVSVKDSSKLDYEALRQANASTDPDPEYTVRIIVSEPNGYKDELKDTIIRVIRVQDVNESPLFSVWPCEITENNQIGDSLGRIEHPSDIDSMSRNIDFYDNQFRLVGGDTALFELKYNTPIDGRPNISLVAKVEFDCESEPYKGKCGVDSAFSVVVDYFDKNDTTNKMTKVVPITLLDQNEKPKITTDSVEVKENVKKGTVVDTIKATDPDVYDSVLTYTLVEDKSGCFEVSKRGVITVKKDNCPALDYETNTELPITVKVTDNGTLGGGEDTLSDTKTIIVKIKDVNEAPKLDDKTIHVAEDTKVNTVIDTVVATDPDKDPKYTELTYSIVKGDTSIFKIDSKTGELVLKDSLDYEDKSEYELVIEVSDGEFKDSAKVTVKVDNVFEQPDVEITFAENIDTTWTDPDTLFTNKSELCIEWVAKIQPANKTMLDSSECLTLHEGENIIIKSFGDSTEWDKPGYDTLVVYLSTTTPVVSIRRADEDAAKTNIFTVVEQSAKGDTSLYVNTPNNDIIITVKDPVAGTKEEFTTKLELDTVSVPTKTFTKTMAGITEFGLALNDNPSSGATHTPVNGEKIAVSYTEKVDGHEVLVTYYTDNDGNLLENADGVVEMTVTYTTEINGHEVKISYQADAVTGTVIKTNGGYTREEDESISSSSSGKSDNKSSSSKGGKSSSSKGDSKSSSSKGGNSTTVENEVVYTISYEMVDESGNMMTVSYGVDAEGNIVRNEDNNIGYLVSYTYTNKYGNSAVQSLFIVLDQAPPAVKILYPTEGEVIYSNFVDVKWTVDIGDGNGPIVQDTLITQSLKKGGNAIVRMYRDKAGNEACDTVRVIMKNAKDVDIAVEQPVTEVTDEKVAEYYASHEPEEGQTFAVTIYNSKTDREVETIVGGDFDNKEGSGDEPYPGLTGHLGPTLGIETKIPTYTAVGGLATLDDLVNKDGLVNLDGVDANEGEKMPVDEYVKEYCTDAFAENLGSDISRANIYKTKMYVKIWIYTSLGSFVDYYTFVQDLDNPDYANNAGLLTLYFEMKPDRDGNVRTQSGRLMATGAYVYKTEVEMKMELQCTLPPVGDASATSSKKGTTRSVTEDLLKSFGYKRPEKN